MPQQTHVNKTQENSSNAVANNMAKTGVEPMQFEGFRPENKAHENLQQMANNSQQVKQLKSLQAIANATTPINIIQRIAQSLPDTPVNNEIVQPKKNESFIGKSIQFFKKVAQFVKPANKAAAQNIINNTGQYYVKGVVGGGKTFGNREGLLPAGVSYIEYDVNKYTGAKRGTERLVKGSDGNVYYTGDHYQSFTKL
jgi:guanyl-specific ribonuclease Sa